MKHNINTVLIVGSPARYPDIRYATSFFSFDPVILLTVNGKKHLVVSPLDVDYVKRTVKNTKVFSFADFPVSKDSKSPACDRVLGLLKRENIRTITVPPYFPAGLARQLSKKGFPLSVAEQNLFPERELKNSAEIKHITHAQKAAVAAMNAAVALIADAKIACARFLKIGNRLLTSEIIRRRIDEAMRDFKCVCHGTIVACGKQAANPHETGFGPLKAGEPIVIDIFPQHIESGYWGDLTRTFCRGNPPARILQIYAAVRDAQKAAFVKIKAGVPAKEVHNAATELFNKRGFPAGKIRGRETGFIHGIGHGVGLEIHESPSVGPVDTKLKAGNVITIEPGLYYPGDSGVRIEDIALVTRTGCRIIEKVKCPFVV